MSMSFRLYAAQTLINLITPALLFLSYCFSEMSPVCAVVGGVLGQEVVKVGLKT